MQPRKNQRGRNREPALRGQSLEAVQGPARGCWRVARNQKRRDRRSARPEPSRQDHLLQMIVGLVPVDGGSIALDDTDVSSLPMHRRTPLAWGICRGAVGVPPSDGREKHHGDPRDAFRADRPTSARICWKSCCTTAYRRAARHARHQSLRRRAPARGRSRARSRPHRVSSCSTNRSPASTRFRLSRFRTLSSTCKNAASVCSLPTITCGENPQNLRPRLYYERRQGAHGGHAEKDSV